MTSMSSAVCAVAAGICLLAGWTAVRRLQHPTKAAPSSSGSELQECVAFLQQHMPERDRGKVDRNLLVHHARLALKARRANSWAAAVPWDIFLNDVLPYRNLDEPLDVDWRSLFLKRFGPIVAASGSTTEAAQLLNRDIWKVWGLHFVPDKCPEIMSPGQTLAAGYASCTGLSIFLADACRAVGVPARVAGTPSWVKDRRDSPTERFNNHNWVEVFDGSSWSFTGACEYNTAGLNRTWFFPQPAKGQIPGNRWHAIYAASFKQTGLPFPLAWAPDDTTVPGVDVTQAYIDASDTWAPTAVAAAAVAAAQAKAAAAKTHAADTQAAATRAVADGRVVA